MAHVSVYVATLKVLDFSEPVNKLPLCTPERHLKHHVNLTINNDNYGGPQLPHHNQMHTANYKSVTANYKSLTANSNRPQQIQIAHGKLNSLTANSRVCLFVEGRGSFFECRGYIVEGPYVTLKNRVYLGVKTCYIFLCFVTSFWGLVIV